MRVLLVNDYGTPTGGAELAMLALRDALRARGHTAMLFASGARPGGHPSRADRHCFGTTSRFRTLVQTANPSAASRLRQLVREFRPDVVHVGLFLTQLSPLILPWLRSVASCYWVHWFRPICPLATKRLPDGTACTVRAGMVCYGTGCLPLRDAVPLTLQMALWRRWRSAFDAIVANSEATRQRLVAEQITVDDVLYPAVPPASPRPPLSAPPTVAFAGRLDRQKGADVLVDAFALLAPRLPAARLLIAGDGPDREALQARIAACQLTSRVALLGHVPRAALDDALASAWVQVVPSRWAEAFGLAAAEAMMRGTAVVASRCDGLGEIVRHGETGLLVPPGDPSALAEAVGSLLEDRRGAEQMGSAGRTVAAVQFDEARFVDRCLRLYETVQIRWRSDGR